MLPVSYPILLPHPYVYCPGVGGPPPPQVVFLLSSFDRLMISGSRIYEAAFKALLTCTSWSTVIYIMYDTKSSIVLLRAVCSTFFVQYVVLFICSMCRKLQNTFIRVYICMYTPPAFSKLLRICMVLQWPNLNSSLARPLKLHDLQTC